VLLRACYGLPGCARLDHRGTSGTLSPASPEGFQALLDLREHVRRLGTVDDAVVEGEASGGITGAMARPRFSDASILPFLRTRAPQSGPGKVREAVTPCGSAAWARATTNDPQSRNSRSHGATRSQRTAHPAERPAEEHPWRPPKAALVPWRPHVFLCCHPGAPRGRSGPRKGRG
jgi:hypothetical protein